MIKRIYFLTCRALLFSIILANGTYGSFSSFRLLRHQKDPSKRILIYGISGARDAYLSPEDFCAGIIGLDKATESVQCFFEKMHIDRRSGLTEALKEFIKDPAIGILHENVHDGKHEGKRKNSPVPWLKFIPCDERTEIFSEEVLAYFYALERVLNEEISSQLLTIQELLEVVARQAIVTFPGLTVGAYKKYLENSYSQLVEWKKVLDKATSCDLLQEHLKTFNDSSHFITATILGSAKEEEHLYKALSHYIKEETAGDRAVIKSLIFDEHHGVIRCFEECTDYLFASIGFLYHVIKDQWCSHNAFTVGMFSECNAYGVCSLLEEVGYKLSEKQSMFLLPVSAYHSYDQKQNFFKRKKDVTKLFQTAFSRAYPLTEKEFSSVFKVLREKILTSRFAQCNNHSCKKEETTSCKFKVCGSCHKAFYCSIACQRKHWKNGHKKECSHRKPGQ